VEMSATHIFTYPKILHRKVTVWRQPWVQSSQEVATPVVSCF
jgi:hypothetical protein